MTLPPIHQAWADAIDGNWCFTDGRHFTIRGSEIVTPGGKRMAGDYDRHAYSYVVPEPEPGAGTTVFMILMDEETIHLNLGADAEQPEIWHRCTLHTS